MFSQKSRNNHYVAQWYQKGFLAPDSDLLYYLNLTPDEIELPNGEVKFHKDCWHRPPSKCFVQYDLYTTVFGLQVNDEVERYLFGDTDHKGAHAIRGYIEGGEQNYHTFFREIYDYISIQKLRTPKGLDWIKSKYTNPDQVRLLVEMQALRNLHCTMWTEGVREIVSAKDSKTKFLVTDHPVTVYNCDATPESDLCKYPNDPDIALLGSQTIFPLDAENCLILTNYEYAENPNGVDRLSKRTNPRNFAQSMVKTISLIRSRNLAETEVQQINFVLKQRAFHYIAASDQASLYPERVIGSDWESCHQVLLPPSNQLHEFGGEMFVGYKDGSTYYQDAFGRTRSADHLNKTPFNPKPNQHCSCGSGKKYKRCCEGKDASDRPIATVLSIRERNLTFYNGVVSILGLQNGKSWEDVRTELSDEHVSEIHKLYEVLWPRDTPLTDLLPRPDSYTSRMLYCGIVDPREIPTLVSSMCLYFDEILLINPFVNPIGRASDFNPVESPSQFKQDTLKNLLLLFQLIPFVERGFVLLLPDPCDFSLSLRHEVINLAEERTDGTKMSDEDYLQFKHLSRDDFERSLYVLPEKQLLQQIQRNSPDLTENQIKDVLVYMLGKKQSDPLALLQDDIYENGGQLNTFNMLPNYEMSLYLAQLTGAIPYTNIRLRWREFLGENSNIPVNPSEKWREICRALDDFSLPLIVEPQLVLNLRVSGVLTRFRRSLSNILSSISTVGDADEIEELSNEMTKSYSSTYDRAMKELDRALGKINYVKNEGASIKVQLMIPEDGIYNAGVERLLLSYAMRKYATSSPMAIFISES